VKNRAMLCYCRGFACFVRKSRWRLWNPGYRRQHWAYSARWMIKTLAVF